MNRQFSQYPQYNHPVKTVTKSNNTGLKFGFGIGIIFGLMIGILVTIVVDKYMVFHIGDTIVARWDVTVKAPDGMLCPIHGGEAVTITGEKPYSNGSTDNGVRSYIVPQDQSNSCSGFREVNWLDFYK
jgi:hypothetical protein